MYQHMYLLISAAWLVTISFLFQFYWSYTSSPEQVRNTIQKQIQKRETDADKVLNDKDLITRLYQGRYSNVDFDRMYEKDYYIFLADVSGDAADVRFWNTQTVVPTADLWKKKKGTYFEKLINGYYTVHRKNIELTTGGTAAAIVLIPVKWNYFVTTNYLNNSFAYVPSIESHYSLSEEESSHLPVLSKSGKQLFWLTEKKGYPQPISIIAVLFRLLAVMMVLLFLHKVSVQIAERYSFAKGFLFIGFALLLLRVLTYLLPVPLDFRQFELFDPAIYGSNFILKSLGDLLINALLILWVLLFARNFGSVPQWIFRIPAIIRAVLLAGLLLGITFLFGAVIRSLVADSQISFNVTNFFSLTLYSFIGFFVLGCLALIYYQLLRVLYPLFEEACGRKFWIQFLLIVVCGFAYLSFLIGDPQVMFNFSLLLWLLLLVLILFYSKEPYFFSPVKNSVIFWLFVFSASLTTLLIRENSEKEWADRKRMAEKFSLQTDPSTENLLSIALANFRNDVLRDEFYRFKSSGSNQFLKDSMLGEHFSGYLNKYDTRIFTYNESEQPLFNDDSTSFNTLNTIYNLQSVPTSVREWRFYEESFDKFFYIARKEIVEPESRLPLGYVFVLSKPRRYADEKFYPELFNKKFNQQTEASPAYAYAIYKKSELISSYNDYSFPIHLPAQYSSLRGFTEQSRNGYSELWYVTDAGRAVVIVRKQNGALHAMTLFAYLFFVFLLIWALYKLIEFFLENGFSRSKWKEQLQLNFRNQVQTTILAISIISFLVIGVSTIVFFINRHSRTNKERLSRTIQIMQNEVEIALNQHAVFDDVLKVYDEVASGELQAKMNRISEIHGVDVNVYDPSGNLKVSSQPYYYNKGLLSRKMEPMAYYKLSKLFLVQTIENEKVGSQQYMSIYVPVRDADGKTYAYLNIPYFTSQNELKLEISSFLVTLINLNAFIFLIAGLIAFVVTNRITASFTFISEKMKEIKLGKENEAIVWNRNDEIGELVQEYNKMVNKLEDSARLLAKSEREGAWREMARQVAHEIKNPLTPMKLSIQYLQKAIDSNAADTKTISKNVAKTLVEQIDYLSNIASDFSSFANITNPRIEKVNIQDSLKAVADLFKMDERAVVVFEEMPGESLFVMGDRTHLNRLFTNLIRNAMEAVPPERKPLIQIRMEQRNGGVLVSIKDNGDGIPEAVREKIFYPNFTTKTSGTGLGLAMCKGIVEQMKGEIRFETGNGTTFFVELPLDFS